MANAQVSGLNLYQPLLDPQGQTELVPFWETERRLQEGYRRLEPDATTGDPYIRLLEEDAARGVPATPTILRPELPRPLNMSTGGPPSSQIYAPEDRGLGTTEAYPPLGGAWLFRPEQSNITRFPQTERSMTGEDLVIDPRGPRPGPAPDLSREGAMRPPPQPDLSIPGFRPAVTETGPDGVVRILPNVSQPLNQNERTFVEAYINAFQPPTLGADAPLSAPPAPGPGEQGVAPSRSRYYMPWGELIRPGDERLAPGEQPYILRNDGTRVPETEIPEGSAYQPSTGRIYSTRPPGTDYRGSETIGGDIARALGYILTEPFHDFGRGIERLENGLVVRDTQVFQEALNIQGILALGTGGVRFGAGRIGPEAPPLLGRGRTDLPPPGPSRSDVTLGTGGAGDVPPSRGRGPAVRVLPTSEYPLSLSRNLETREPNRIFQYEIIQDGRPVGWTTGSVEASNPTQAHIARIGIGTRTEAEHMYNIQTNVLGRDGIRQLREAFRRDFPDVTEFVGRRVTGAGRRNQVVRLAANPDEPAPGAVGLLLGGRRGRNIIPETDPAGYYLQSREVAANLLPASGTAGSMRNRLLRAGVTEEEIRGLRLDDIFYGPSAASRRDWEDAYRAHSILAREYGDARKKLLQHPDNQVYRDTANDLDIRLRSSSNRLDTLRTTMQIEGRRSVMDQVRAFREAERQLKLAEAGVRDATRRGSNYGRENALQDRAKARQDLAAARKNLESVSTKENPLKRRVTSQEIVSHIEANRPRLDTFTRRVPTLQEELGPYAAGIQRVYDTDQLRDALVSGGAGRIVSDELTKQIKTLRDPINWAVHAQDFSMRAGLRRESLTHAIESVTGVPLSTINRHLTQSRTANTIVTPTGESVVRPRYSFAIPDRNNPTLHETAVTMTSPGGGGKTPRMESAHWPRSHNVVGHLQTAIQRAPTVRTAAQTREASRLAKIIRDIEVRRKELEKKMDELGQSTSQVRGQSSAQVGLSQAWNVLTKKMDSIRARVIEITAKSSDDMIYMGYQFQSDAPRGGHALTRDVRSWLRPMLEKFVEQGVASDARYIGIPNSKAVATWNTIGEGTARLYDKTIRDELDYILRRRGIRPVSRRTVDRLFPVDGTGPGFSGSTGAEWHLIEMPRGQPRGHGQRLYSGSEEPAAGLAGLTISNISRQPGFPQEVLRRRAAEGQSLIRRIRGVQPGETELRHYPRAERIEVLGPDDPHPGPVIGYHGTGGGEFSRFDLDLSRDIGHHFGTREQANARVGTRVGVSPTARVIPAYLNVRNPIRLRDLGAWSPIDTAAEILSVVRAGGDPINTLLARNMVDAVQQGGLSREERFREIRDGLTRMGYDSIRYRNRAEGVGWSYIVWTPNLVRSVTDPSHVLYQSGVPISTGGQGGQESTNRQR